MVYTPAYLTGGSSPTTDIPTWQAVTSGSFKITINGTLRSITGLNFSTDTTMDLIAARIQAAIRTATSSTETCVWNGTQFIITSADTAYTSAITVTTAGASGTDISGAGATAFMDCDTGHGVVTAVSASLGWTVLDIFNESKLQIFGSTSDTSINANTYRQYLNEAYLDIQRKLDELDANWDIEDGTPIDLTPSSSQMEQTFSLDTYAPRCKTIVRVDYLPPSSEFNDDFRPLPETQYDEKYLKTNLRWYRKGSSIVFRGVTYAVDNVTIRYKPRREILIADTDRPDFPPKYEDYHSILIAYVKYKYYKDRNMETDWQKYFLDYQTNMQMMIDAIIPTDEPRPFTVIAEDGEPDIDFIF